MKGRARVGDEQWTAVQGDWQSSRQFTRRAAEKAAERHGPGKYVLMRSTLKAGYIGTYWSGEGQGFYEVRDEDQAPD